MDKKRRKKQTCVTVVNEAPNGWDIGVHMCGPPRLAALFAKTQKVLLISTTPMPFIKPSHQRNMRKALRPLKSPKLLSFFLSQTIFQKI
jgi:hypothetical protein